MSRFVYLHGFASAPTSKKAGYFRERFAARGIQLEIPDLAAGDFDHLTITSQLKVIEHTAGGGPVNLIGSSMGGYLAALYAARHPEAEHLVLMAPAFSFATRWKEHLGPEAVLRWKETGMLPVQHYGDGRTHQLDYGLMDDASEYEDYPDFPQPAIIFHGRYDDVVPPEYSITFAEQHPNAALHLMESDHELLNVLDLMWREVEDFLLIEGGQRQDPKRLVY